MKEANSNFKNAGNDENDLIEFFSGNKNCFSEPAQGSGDYSTYSEDFHETDIPVKIGERTRLMLTHPNHMISHFEKGFISMSVNFQVGLETKIEPTAFLTASHLQYIFVGFKNAVEIISDCKFYCNGELIGSYHQNEMTRESYAYNSTRPKDVKNGTSKAHSLWENVINMSPNVAGVYIPLKDLLWSSATIKYVDVKMDLIIPFTDQLTFQYWRLYPNYALGEIVEEIRTSLDALVWCQIPPENVARVKQLEGYNRLLNYNVPENMTITNGFTQIGHTAKIVSKVEETTSISLTDKNTFCINSGTDATKWFKYTIDNNRLLLRDSNAEIKIGKTNCIGFGLKYEVAEEISNIFKSGKEIRLPALELKRFIFEQKPNINGLKTTKILPIHNATNIKLMFPRDISDLTVYRNIMYRNCQFFIDKTPFPYQPYRTTYDGRFVQFQLMSYELDNTRAPKELVESISQPLNDVSVEKVDGSYPRKRTNAYDDTDFSINIQLDRGNAGYNFEGTSTKGAQILCQFQGLPIATGDYDTYMEPYTNAIGVVQPRTDETPAPEMWIFSYCYWSWKLNGVDYINRIPDYMNDPVKTNGFSASVSLQALV